MVDNINIIYDFNKERQNQFAMAGCNDISIMTERYIK